MVIVPAPWLLYEYLSLALCVDFFKNWGFPLSPVRFIQILLALNVVDGDPNGSLVQRFELQNHHTNSAYIFIINVTLSHDIDNYHVCIEGLLDLGVADEYLCEQVR